MMLDIINKIIDKCGEGLCDLLSWLCRAVVKVSEYLLKRQEIQEKKEEKKAEDAEIKKIEDACDKGSLDDLMNAVTKTSAILLVTLAAGCQSIKVQTTKQWEGHYMSSEDFQEKTKNINLERGESIWVLSNNTLKRLLLETKKENKK